MDARGGRIADPVHVYVDFTWIERLILDHPVAQRLRYIRQNGLGHLVFPEANSSRFAHSLGTMHLASRFLTAILVNSDDVVRARLCSAMADVVDETAGPVSNYESSLASLPAAATRCIRAHSTCSHHTTQVKVSEQALRLAALFHDLGHLPFSHDFEEGLLSYREGMSPAAKKTSPVEPLFREAGRTGEKLHERLGHGLALVLFNEVFANLIEPQTYEAARVVFDVAYRILADAPKRPANAKEAALTLLHGLVDGELDVDRCDYLLRDGRNYGFEFASYDLERLVDNLRIAERDGAFHLAVRSHGLTALESFTLARFRSYENGVRHHKVAQVGAALRDSIGQTLKRFRNTVEMAQFARDLGRVGSVEKDTPRMSDPEGLLRRFAMYDDGWLMGWLRRLEAESHDLWLQVACWRQPAKSLWKRADEFRAYVGGDIAMWNRDLPRLDDDDQVARWTRESRRLRAEGVLVVRHRFEPWKADPLHEGDSSLLVEISSGKYEPVNRASKLVDSLQDAWEHAVQVHAFVSVGSDIDPREVLRRLPRVESQEDG